MIEHGGGLIAGKPVEEVNVVECEIAPIATLGRHQLAKVDDVMLGISNDQAAGNSDAMCYPPACWAFGSVCLCCDASLRPDAGVQGSHLVSVLRKGICRMKSGNRLLDAAAALHATLLDQLQLWS